MSSSTKVLLALAGICALLSLLGALWLLGPAPEAPAQARGLPPEGAPPGNGDVPIVAGEESEPAGDGTARVDASPRAGEGDSGSTPREVLVRVVRAKDQSVVGGAQVRMVSISPLIALSSLGNRVMDDIWHNRRPETYFTAADPLETTDDQGEVHLPAPAMTAFLVGHAADLWGMAIVQNVDRGRTVVLALERDGDLEVRTHWLDGSPAPGIPVAVYPDERASRGLLGGARPSDPAGQVGFQHLRSHLEERGLEQGARVAIAMPARRRDVVPLSLEAWPAAPVRLEAPLHGSVEVRLERTGRGGALVELDGDLRLRHRSSYGAWSSDASGWEDWVGPLRIRAGVASISHVGLGLELELSAGLGPSHGPVYLRSLGPTKAGERLVVSIPIGDSYPFVLGRAVDPAGRSLGSERCVVRIVLEDPQDGRRIDAVRDAIQLDAEGGFRVPVSLPWSAGLARSLSLRTVSMSDAQPLRADVDLSALLDSPELDLGEVVLRPAPCTVGGQVVDPDGVAVAEASVEVVGLDAEGRSLVGGQLWLRTDRQGHFALYELEQAADFRIRATRPGYADSEAVTAVAGSADVRVVLRPESLLAGRVVLDERVPPEWVRVSLHYAGEGTGDPSLDELEQEVAIGPGRAMLDPEGRFEFRGLPEGDAVVEVAVLGERAPLARVEGIRILRGRRTLEPRLEAIDLRGRVHVLEVEVVDTAGEPVPDAFGRCTGSEIPVPVFMAHRGAMLLASSREITEIVVSANGHGDAVIANPSDPTRAVLSRGVTLTLTRPPGVELPRGVELIVALDLIRGQGGHVPTRLYASGRLAGTSWVDGEKGVNRDWPTEEDLRLTIVPGIEYQLYWHLSKDRRTVVVRPAVHEKILLHEDGTRATTIDHAAIPAALEKLFQ